MSQFLNSNIKQDGVELFLLSNWQDCMLILNMNVLIIKGTNRNSIYYILNTLQ